MKSAIKLLKLNELEDGTIRLQSQLSIGKDGADFIMEDGILKCYGFGINGFGFHEYSDPYEIVLSKSDMMYQPL